MITVLIADDQVNVRDVLRRLLENAGDVEIVGMASNGREAVEQAALYSPHVVTMDVSMPVLDGIEATKQICANHPKTRVLMVSMHNNPSYIAGSIRAGALGYVLKDTAGDELVTAIHAVYNNTRYFSRQIYGIAQRLLSEGSKDDPTSNISSE